MAGVYCIKETELDNLYLSGAGALVKSCTLSSRLEILYHVIMI